MNDENEWGTSRCAGRERQVVYQTLNLPLAFADKCAVLERRPGRGRRGPLLLVSAARQNTGVKRGYAATSKDEKREKP
ncbi:MAG: hypothetical protein PHR35_03565 [Kiritimatiellae bacterium]|nr:hypothetical protein [Kiritimatiellia bacterium]